MRLFQMHWRYFKYVMRHKWFVLVASFRIGGSIFRAIIHDLSKFMPSEWFAYADYFYGGSWPARNSIHGDMRNLPIKTAEDVQEAFDIAWLVHQRRNRHHWQWWVLHEDNPDISRYLVQENGQCYSPIMLYDDRKKRVVAEFPFQDGSWEESQKAYLAAKAHARHLCTKVLSMPRIYVYEMVADWMGAGRAITGKWDCAAWYKKNRDKIQLHPDTRKLVEQILCCDPVVCFDEADSANPERTEP